MRLCEEGTSASAATFQYAAPKFKIGWGALRIQDEASVSYYVLCTLSTKVEKIVAVI